MGGSVSGKGRRIVSFSLFKGSEKRVFEQGIFSPYA